MYNYVRESIICKVKLTLWRFEAMTMALQREDPTNSRPFANGSLANSLSQGKPSRRKGSEDQLVERIRRHSSLSHEDFIKMKDAEQQDDFFATRKAQDIVNPDTNGDGHSLVSIKIVPNSFRRLLGVKEICSKQGTFLHRTIDLPHRPGDALGFLIRQGDGWSRTDGIFISRLILGTDVDNYELLRVGDEIIRVNKVEVRSMNVEDVSALMQMAKRLIITVKVLTPLSKKKLFALNSGRTRAVSISPSPRAAAAAAAAATAAAATTAAARASSDTAEQKRSLSVPLSNADSWRSVSSPSLSHRSNYKIANLEIGKSTDNGTSVHLPRSRLASRFTTPVKRALSPIRETTDQLSLQSEPNSILTSSTGRRKSLSSASVTVSWSDQVSLSGQEKSQALRSKSNAKAVKGR